MKFTMDLDTLDKLLKPAVKCASSNRTLQILSHIYVRLNDNDIEVIGANPEYTVKVRGRANIEEEGEFLVLGDKFLQIIKSLPGSTVSIKSIENNSIIVESLEKPTNFVLQTISVEEYPKQILSYTETSYDFEISQKEMKKVIRKLIKFCSESDTLQAIFTGFLFELKETGDLVFVTTDTKRMGVFYTSYKALSNTINTKFVVPSDTLDILEEVLNDEGPLRIGINIDEDGNVRNVVFKVDGVVISSSVISGNFPNYSAVIPNTTSNYSQINKKELEQAIKRVSIMADKETNKVTFFFGEDTLNIKSENSILGQASESIPCKFFGTPDYISFNYQYILDYLSSLDADEFYWGFNHYESGNKFWSDKEKEFIYVAMPLRRG
ncbi:MAG: DNA polymerase III subunit beta [Brevinematia bacterium]